MYELVELGRNDRIFHNSYGFRFRWISFISAAVNDLAARFDVLGVEHELFAWEVQVVFASYVEEFFWVVEQLSFCFEVKIKAVYPRLYWMLYAIKQW